VWGFSKYKPRHFYDSAQSSPLVLLVSVLVVCLARYRWVWEAAEESRAMH